jgi:hypothetical protein
MTEKFEIKIEPKNAVYNVYLVTGSTPDVLLYTDADKLVAIKKARKQLKHLCYVAERDLVIEQRAEEKAQNRF